MKSLKNKIWLGVLVILIFILFLQHLNGNNLDKFRVLDKKPYYSIMFDYTGKPNLPEMIGVIRPNIKGYLQKKIMNLQTTHLKKNQKQVEL